MLERKNSVVFIAPWIDACSLWRLYMPHLAMPGSSFFCFAQRPDFSVITPADVCVVQRCCTAQQLEFLRMMPVLGIQVIYDLDDNVWDVPKYNPAHEVLMRNREGFNACIRMVDVVTVSTKTLAKVVRKHVKFMVNARTGREIPIVVCENRIEERMFVAPVKNEKVIVGWAGSSSHIGDLDVVEEAIISCASEFPDVRFEFRGCEPPEASKLRKLSAFQHRLWTPVPEFGARMPLWGWSVALAPVTDHEFNASKSCIKMVEAAYCGIPCLASAVRPYEEFCGRDKELGWLLCTVPGTWKRKLRELLNDKARREELGRRMYDVMKQHYCYDKPHEGWDAAITMARDASLHTASSFVRGSNARNPVSIFGENAAARNELSRFRYGSQIYNT